MEEIIKINVNDIIPGDEDVLRHQGILPGTNIDEVVKKLLIVSRELFENLAEPLGILRELEPGALMEIYEGEGQNEKSTPLKDIFPKASECALFAVTAGADVSRKIDDLFLGNEFAVGCMLDSFASVGADCGAGIVEKHYRQYLEGRGRLGENDEVVRYSPGYCGWHLSAQKKLFGILRPETIGITLRDSFLMEPLKSISGVLLSGPKEIHVFENKYPCCEQCIDRSCEGRINKIRSSLK